MANKIINITLWVVLLGGLGLALIVGGCQSSGWKEGDYTGQGVQARYEKPAVPGVVIATHEDGTQTVTPLPADPPPQSAPARRTAPAADVPPPPRAANPVMTTTIIPAQGGLIQSYTITPEMKKGDQIAGSRCCTWAGEAPGTVVEKVATQKERITRNPLPAVSLDASGIHAGIGGGSVDDQAGRSWWQNVCTWFSDMFKGWIWWLVIAGVVVAAFFLLPIALPFLKPLFTSIAGGVHAAWTWLTGEFGKLLAAIKAYHAKTTPPASVAPAASTTVAPAAPVATAPTAPAVTAPRPY